MAAVSRFNIKSIMDEKDFDGSQTAEAEKLAEQALTAAMEARRISNYVAEVRRSLNYNNDYTSDTVNRLEAIRKVLDADKPKASIVVSSLDQRMEQNTLRTESSRPEPEEREQTRAPAPVLTVSLVEKNESSVGLRLNSDSQPKEGSTTLVNVEAKSEGEIHAPAPMKIAAELPLSPPVVSSGAKAEGEPVPDDQRDFFEKWLDQLGVDKICGIDEEALEKERAGLRGIDTPALVTEMMAGMKETSTVLPTSQDSNIRFVKSVEVSSDLPYKNVEFSNVVSTTIIPGRHEMAELQLASSQSHYHRDPAFKYVRAPDPFVGESDIEGCFLMNDCGWNQEDDILDVSPLGISRTQPL